MAGVNFETIDPVIPSKNPISLLQEVSAIHKLKLPEYRDGEGTYSYFGCDLTIYHGHNPEDDVNFHGRGKTKKAAKTEAAEKAISFLREQHPEVFSPPPPTEIAVDINTLSPMVREMHLDKMPPLSSNKQTFSTKSETLLASETEEVGHRRLGLEFGQLLQKTRMEKGLTQKDLASKINEKSNVVVEYEAGRAVPNSHIVSKLERALRIKLVGPSAGQPFNRKK